MPAGVSAYIPLANTTIGVAAASVTFSSISSSYRDLVLVITGLNNSTNSSPSLRFNTDTGSNYTTVSMEADGTSTFSGTNSNTSLLSSFNYSTLTTGGISNTIFNIMDYSASDKFKMALARGNYASGAVAFSFGRWVNTGAITTVQVLTGNGTSYAAGATFALFGVSV